MIDIQIISHERHNADGSENNLILYHRKHFQEHLSGYDIFLLGELSLLLAT
jgi:hypothetical protein